MTDTDILKHILQHHFLKIGGGGIEWSWIEGVSLDEQEDNQEVLDRVYELIEES
ncbi:MAG: hypothetical protein GOVbin4162_117 [Prokaryotic dsDNA virus sp.]|nr:MAG: hypothetical protein GOVbin4162_117 [Prokaryotic dsDNA virus sp.]|tara:strand:- start:213 stop:374 length:162 start_codon:yes stop_codon:yes gene_type:complete